MTAATMRVSFRAPALPWSVATADDTRFRRIWQTVLTICTLACLIVLLMPVVKPDRSKAQELPPVMAKLLLDKAPTPPAPPVKAPPATPIQPQATTAAIKPEALKPLPPPKPIKPQLQKETLPDAKTPVPNQAPGESTEGARRKAASVGLFAANEDLAPLRAKAMAVQLNPDIKQGPGVGTGVGKGVGAGNEDGVPTRAMITSNATTGSGGISTASYSRDTGGAGLGGRATTLVAGGSPNGVDGGTGSGGSRGGGGLGGEGNGTGTGTGKGGTLQKGGGGKASRSIEEIKLVFERNKGAIYAIYNRALREDPGLQGKVVLELSIAPSGALVACRIVSSELHAAELESKLLARIRQFEFGAKDVDQIVVTWPVDFLPS